MNTNPLDNPGMATAYAIFLTVYNGIILLALLYGFRRGRDLRRGVVSQVTGPIKLRFKEFPSERHMPTAYFAAIGKIEFQFETARQYDLLEDGAEYRVFYVNVPPTGWILSIESVKTPSF